MTIGGATPAIELLSVQARLGKRTCPVLPVGGRESPVFQRRVAASIFTSIAGEPGW